MSRDSPAEPRALFVGLCTLDIIQSVTHVPAANEKMTALRQTVAAGGPATNAAVTFAHLGGHSTLVTGVGDHPLAEGIRADLQQAGVALIDVAGGDAAPPPVSSIMVTAGSGERSVVSLNATGRDAETTRGARCPSERLSDRADRRASSRPRTRSSPRRRARSDGCASWTEEAGRTTRAIYFRTSMWPCALPIFTLQACRPAAETLDYLLDSGVTWAAITNGARPIIWAGPGMRSEIPVPTVTVMDTLGAGDIFHGAFGYAISEFRDIDSAGFISALQVGAKVAAYACQSFGTRTWMKSGPTHALA